MRNPLKRKFETCSARRQPNKKTHSVWTDRSIFYICGVTTDIHISKDKMIRAASKLIRHRGYYGFGLKEVLEACSLPKGSLYHHFPGGKDDLVIEALRFAAEEQVVAYREAMKGKGSAEKGLIAVIDVLIDGFSDKGVFYGCPLASVAMDIGENNKILSVECRKQFQFWIDSIQSYLEYKNISDAQTRAHRYMRMLEGAIILSQIWQSTEHLENMKKDVSMLLST